MARSVTPRLDLRRHRMKYSTVFDRQDPAPNLRLRLPNLRLAETFRYWESYREVRATVSRYDPARDMRDHPFPSVVQVQTINACNAACIMCPYGRSPASKLGGRMDDALWDKLVDEIAEHPEAHTFIPMLQNEPFLDQQLLDKVRSFKQRTHGRVKVELVTHGGLLTPDIIEALRFSALDVLSISVDSIRPDVYEKIRVGLKFDRLMANIQRLVEARLDVHIVLRMVRQAANADEVAEFVAFWKARGLQTTVWNVANRSGAVDNFKEVEVLANDTPWYSLVGDSLLGRLLPRCPLPFSTTAILHNGDVLACGFDWLHEVVIGNVRHSTIAEIWNSASMRQFRRQHYEKRAGEIGMCSRCSIWQKTWADKQTIDHKEATQ